MNSFVEDHPWNFYPIDKPISKLIIGSFPPNKMTISKGSLVTYQDGKEVKINKDTKDFDFFYGSTQNEFWNLFINSLDLQFTLPLDFLILKKWLVENRWGLTDIILQTTRKKSSPSDQDLVPIKWNVDTIENILKFNNITHIYFTIKWLK